MGFIVGFIWVYRGFIQGGAPKIAKLVNITPITIWFLLAIYL